MAGVMNFTTPRSLARIERILAALAERPMTRQQLQARLFMAKSTAYLFINHLMDKPRRVRIAQWLPPDTIGRHTPVYALGTYRNAPEPPRISKAARWQALKADPAKHAQRCAERRCRAIRPRADPLHAWIPRHQEPA